MHRSILTIILFFSFWFFGCQPKSEPLVIPNDDLINALADIHIVEGALLSIRPVMKDSIRTLYYSQVYEIHGITAESFEHDVDVLKRNPKLMEKVYEKVMAELNKREKDHGKKNNKGKKKDLKKPESKK